MNNKTKIIENLFDAAYELHTVDKTASLQAKNHHTTLFTAINHANWHSVIKINPGVYQERIEIMKPDIKIQANDLTSNVILVNEEFPNIMIDLPQKTDKVFLELIKMANICENHSQSYSSLNKSYSFIKSQNFRGYKISETMNCCLYLKCGTLQLDECRLSLASYSNPSSVVPCIVVEKDGILIVNRSELRGTDGTIGIVCKGGQVIVKESVIKDHGGAGIMMIGKKKTNLVIKNSSISSCLEGIVLNGPFSAIIDNNTIIQCETGMSLMAGNTSQIMNNEIRQCKNGISVENGLPSILKNIFTQNSEYGFRCTSRNNCLCKCSLKFNNFWNNEIGGVYVSGVLNKSQLINNQFVSNGKYGIKVEYQAFPHIFMNKINKTIGNGVHICENSSVFLEKNQINGSLKCNLVLQGPKNINNFIYENTITNARGDGIFIIYGQKFIIEHNQITKNHNGIMVATGVLTIRHNRIAQNQKNGLLLVQDNNLIIQDNTFSHNKEGGLVIRDSSIGVIKNNIFDSNKAQIVIENDHESFNTIESENTFKGSHYDIRIPKNYRCLLI